MSDWDDFIRLISWYLDDDDEVERIETDVRSWWRPPSDSFAAMYPRLGELLSTSRRSRVLINNQEFHLYGWAKANHDTLGWLCHPPVTHLIDKALHADHKLLLTGLGGILERWNEFDDSWLSNHNNALGEDESMIEACSWDEHYRFVCNLDHLEPVVNCKDYIAFAFEGNGDFTAYHRETSAVLMYAHDHCFDYIQLYKGCPENTWYSINECADFRTWVETVAEQWLNTIMNSSPDEPVLYPPPAAGLVPLKNCKPIRGTLLHISTGTPTQVFIGMEEKHLFPNGKTEAGLQMHPVGRPDQSAWVGYEWGASYFYVNEDDLH